MDKIKFFCGFSNRMYDYHFYGRYGFGYQVKFWINPIW